MAPEQKTFVFAEVSKHNKTKDCWVIISGKVYDLTPFMDTHPGGPEVILATTGKDATDDYEDVGHSDDAKKMMDDYYIGNIHQSTVPQNQRIVMSKTHNSDFMSTIKSSEKTQQLIGKILKFLVPFMILGLAFTVRAYTKN